MIQRKELPSWACIAADDAYGNGSNILTPYGGNNLPQWKSGFNFYLSSCRVTVEKVFGILVARFGIFWSPLRHKLSKTTLIIMVACKLHNFIIDNGDVGETNHGWNSHEFIPMAEENRVRGSPIVHTQNVLQLEQNQNRSRQRNREESELRSLLAHRLHDLGNVRPPQMRRN